MNPLLLLHGALGAKSQLDSLQKKSEAGREVYTMNFSGHGGEAFKNTFGIETFAHDVIHFLDQTKIQIGDIFGYSMGGYVAVWLAHKFPDRVGRITTLGTKFDWSPESAEKEVRKLNAEKILEKVPAFARILEHRHAPHDWKVLLQKTAEMMLQLGQSPLLTEQNLKTISHPITVCLGDQDDMADRIFSDQVSHWLLNGSFQEFQNTPHPIEKVELEKLMIIFNHQ